MSYSFISRYYCSVRYIFIASQFCNYNIHIPQVVNVFQRLTALCWSGRQGEASSKTSTLNRVLAKRAADLGAIMSNDNSSQNHMSTRMSELRFTPTNEAYK